MQLRKKVKIYFFFHFLPGIPAAAGLEAHSDFCYIRTADIFPQSINVSQKENNTVSQG
jgi:hypothetical protein